MLTLLDIKNIAVIEHSEIEFSEGLNILTGETGAGKSIILKAIELICGGKSTADLVRAGAEKAQVQAVFQLDEKSKEKITQSLEDVELSEEIIVRRVIDKSGKSKIFLNERIITQALLQKIMVSIIDMTNQHESQALLSQDFQRILLDDFIEKPEVLTAYVLAYKEFFKSRKLLEEFVQKNAETSARFNLLNDEKKELSSFQITLGEKQEIEEQLKILSANEQLISQTNDLIQSLDSDNGLDLQIRKISTQIEDIADLDKNFQAAFEFQEAIATNLNELINFINHYINRLELAPERLEELRERMNDLVRLERKYRRPIDELVEYYEKITLELSSLENQEILERNLRVELEKSAKKLEVQAAQLSAQRVKAKEKLEKEVNLYLKKLELRQARFQIKLEEIEASNYGQEKITFLISTNPGEGFKDLHKIASGGELARILLILKVLSGKVNLAGCQIFDEIDVGVSGAVAQTLGENLKELSKSSQVILITHSAQVAAFADTHFMVQKEVKNNRTYSSITLLNQKDRKAQIAKMLAGKHMSDSFLDSAQELIVNSR